MGKLRITWVLMLITTLIVQPGVQAMTSLGMLSSCGHDVKGEVFVTSKKEFMIKGFHYDGKGPGTFFTAMKKSATSVQPTGDNFQMIPYEANSEGPCKVISFGTAIAGVDVNLRLQQEINSYKSIGVYCHQFCNNFGHVKIPEDIDMAILPDTPESAGTVTDPATCLPLNGHFKKPLEDSKDCTKVENLHNADFDKCESSQSTTPGSAGFCFRPSKLMTAAVGIGFLGLI